ncbi:MFS transporter [Hyphococcus luteus]|uniref:MFS transporter n=1 Tax=Hyphococcus luteus TaxID=2058213 RepID=A0A2S7K0Q3_9PROT|nr:MFS transporter [Marinicaulis flavus]PQA86082.1 MFS transporter [Marinicaulis flavus]
MARLILPLFFMVMMIDGYDLAAMPLALPYLVEAMGVEPSAFSTALSAVLLGLGVGALLIGPLGDRFGRRLLIVSSLALIGAATIGTGFSASITEFVIWRFFTGLALGACLPNITAYTAELAPPERKATSLAVISAGISIGAILAGLITPALVKLGGWLAIFHAAGAFILVLAAALFAALPKTQAPASENEAAPAARGSILAPLSPRYLPATAVFVGLYTVNAFILYMIVSWLPHLLTTDGLSADAASQLTAFFQGGGLAGGLVISWFIDRGRRVYAFTIAYALVIAAFFATGAAAGSAFLWSVLLLVIGGGVSGAHLAIMASSASFYPQSVFSSAIGLAVAVARIGAIAGPLAGGALVARDFAPQPFLLVCGAPVLICIAIVMASARVKKAEEIEPA